jgi:uncharacterized protein YgfB (UPF0149 family)
MDADMKNMFDKMGKSFECTLKKCKKEQDAAAKANKKYTDEILNEFKKMSQLNNDKMKAKSDSKLAELNMKIKNSDATLAVAKCSYDKCMSEKKELLEIVYKVTKMSCEKNAKDCEKSKQIKKVLDLIKTGKLTLKKMTDLLASVNI